MGGNLHFKQSTATGHRETPSGPSGPRSADSEATPRNARDEGCSREMSGDQTHSRLAVGPSSFARAARYSFDLNLRRRSSLPDSAYHRARCDTANSSTALPGLQG